MLFSSPDFFIFFVFYFILHLIVPIRFRNYLIIAGSTVFYAWWKLAYVWLPYFLMATAYFGTLWVDRTDDPRARRRRAAATIVVLFLPLVFFKYTNFVYRDVIGVAAGFHDTLFNLPLPLGVSFVTFTLTSYVVDTYNRSFRTKHSPVTVLSYVLFFPHLIAGPILRPDELIPQLEAPRRVTLRRIVVPLAIFSLGLVKKLVFADQVGETVTRIYAQPGVPSAWDALLAMYGFSLQIYCDFSGYTDMAIGLALALGVRLPNNFSRPYLATSIIDFWRRWHITLSFWLRDYLYIPLGGGRGGRVPQIRNIMITMALGGLWHGASWTFVVWGVIHGAAVSIVHVFGDWRRVRRQQPLPRWLGLLITFQFVTIAWVFFRAGTMTKASEILSAPFVGSWAGVQPFLAANAFPIALLAVFVALHRFDDHRRVKVAIRRMRPELIWLTIALAWIVAITISQGSSAAFIYFDF